MKKSKFLISLTASLLIAGNALGLVACGDDGSVSGIQTGDVEAVAYDGKEITISFYHCMGSDLKDQLDNAIADFNKIYPKITVQHTSFGDYPGVRDQIKTEVSTGRGPSLAYCYPDHVALYQKSKAVLDLDDYIASTLTVTRADGTTEQVGLTQDQINDYVPIYYNEGKIYGDTDGDGTDDMYTLPMMKSTELLYYNKTYFDANNLTVPTTWDEVESVCAQILAIESAKEGGLDANPCIPFTYDSSANWFITMTEQYAKQNAYGANNASGYTTSTPGSHFVFNNETNVNFVQRFAEWYEKGYLTTEEIRGTYTSDLFKQPLANKLKSYMCVGSSAGAKYQTPTATGTDASGANTYPFEVGVTMLPQIDPQNPTMISQGPSLCLFKKQNTQETAAAWLFAKFLTTNVKAQASFSMQNGYTCAIQSVMDNAVYADFIDDADGNEFLRATAIVKTKEYMNYYFVSPAFNGSSTARDEMATLMKTCFTQGVVKSGNAIDSAATKTKIQGFFNTTYNTLKSNFDKTAN